MEPVTQLFAIVIENLFELISSISTLIYCFLGGGEKKHDKNVEDSETMPKIVQDARFGDDL